MPIANQEGHYAGFISRLFAFIIDVLVLSVTLTITIWFITTINNAFNLPQFYQAIFGITPGAGFYSVIIGLIVSSYFVFFWVLIGQTPGKTIMGLRVVAANGKRVSVGRGVLRLIGYIISALPLYGGFVWILLDDRREGWHDKIAGTHVIYVWAARPDENFLKHKF